MVKRASIYIKEHTSCRWCGVAEETLEHIINCGREVVVSNVEEILAEMDLEKLNEVALRVSRVYRQSGSVRDVKQEENKIKKQK